MPSFGYGVVGAPPKSAGTFVSFSQNSIAGAVPSLASPAASSSSPRNGCSMVTALFPLALPPLPVMSGFGSPSSQDQVFRNHAVGSTCSVSGSGPAFVTLTTISSSAASADLAYLTSVIQYLSSSKTPVSRISYSGSRRSRLLFSTRTCS
jgi:hypothetical protein